MVNLIQEADPFLSWSHLGVMGVILVPIFLFWLDNRNQARDMHVENQVRLKEIEVKLKEVWDWWKRDNGNGGHE